MKLAIALSLVSTLAHADPQYACKEHTGKFAVTVAPEITVDEFALWVMGATCKTIVYDAGKSSTKLKVMAPKELTPAQLIQLFVDSVKVVGLTATVKGDSIIVTGTPTCVASGPSTPPNPTTASDDAELDKEIAAGIVVVDATHRKLARSLVDKILGNPMAVSKGARIVPAVKDGKPNGFKLYAIRPSSFYAKLGFENGDTLQEINGFSLDSADKALEVYTKLREAPAVEIAIVRRGQPLKLYITIN